jgi:hypothetical protein
MSNLLDQLIPFSPSIGAARAALSCYCQIAMQGSVVARKMYSKPTWYRHLRVLKNAGFTVDHLDELHAAMLHEQSKLPEGVVLRFK